ncbi:hypothetical protein JQ594_28160 [Bradyrhizobium manausense]|uniref:hypothetical protein n=1 Tax=Bradyrhizobium manausense TaxID=989370 RepID=UPI001BA88646|nr:hypothetical protein [Bradyrhizobium manausense]MBR0689816.1 hypothetical protein [Bradyrhizobium manausense]MBR0725405.1 hypothetical protein [Bradyrhizobium manausense]
MYCSQPVYRRISRLASLLGKFVLGVGALFIGPQTHAAPTIYGTYYDETASSVTACQNTYVCRQFLSQLPSDKLLMVTKLICVFVTQARVTEAQLYVSTTNDGSGTLPRHLNLPLPAAPAPSTSGLYYTTVDMEPQWLLGQGRYPYVVIVTSGSGSMAIDCTIRGELVTPIQ